MSSTTRSAVSTSLVVPAREETIALSDMVRAFRREDLPALTCPIMATSAPCFKTGAFREFSMVLSRAAIISEKVSLFTSLSSSSRSSSG